jgi:hypothetical protein
MYPVALPHVERLDRAQLLGQRQPRGFTSVAKIRPAPAAFATVTAISPMIPTPVISTLLALTPAAITVCTALPSGSSTAATLSGIFACTGHTFSSGTTAYSAKHPSRSIPRIFVSLAMCALPVRELKSSPAVMCPSALTRSPGLYLRHRRADLFDHAHELVARDDPHRDPPRRPLVPLPDVPVGPADPHLLHTHQHVPRPAHRPDAQQP